MDTALATAIFFALGQKTRLETFRLLVRAGPSGMIASEIADALGAPRNTMSPHFKLLLSAKLILAQKDKKTIIYRANMSQLADVCAFLVESCCNGNASDCEPELGRIGRALQSEE